MKITRHQLAGIFGKQLMSGPVKPIKFAQEIATYLLAESRTAELEPLLRDIAKYRAEHAIVEVTAVSAHELSSEDRSDIELFARGLHPGAKAIIMNTHQDPSLIGGVRLEIIAQQLDLTVRTQLNRMKQLTMSERSTA